MNNQIEKNEIPASSFFSIGARLAEASNEETDLFQDEEGNDTDSEWSCSNDYQDCTWDTECEVCSRIIRAGGELYAGGEIETYSMCKECWERPQHDCVNSCYLVNGLCPYCHAEENIVLK